MTKLGPLPDWRNLPVLYNLPETEFIALPWQCEYCGSTNPGEALYCGQCGPSHCGAPKPGCDETPSWQLQESNLVPFGSFYVIQESSPLPRGAIYAVDDDDPLFYPEPAMKVTHHPGKLAQDFKLELGKRVLAAFQRAIKGVLSLC